jgi:hypothetical protein
MSCLRTTIYEGDLRKRSFDDLEATDESSAANKPTTNSHGKKAMRVIHGKIRDIHADDSSRESGRRKSSREEPVLEEGGQRKETRTA